MDSNTYVDFTFNIRMDLNTYVDFTFNIRMDLNTYVDYCTNYSSADLPTGHYWLLNVLSLVFLCLMFTVSCFLQARHSKRFTIS